MRSPNGQTNAISQLCLVVAAFVGMDCADIDQPHRITPVNPFESSWQDRGEPLQWFVMQLTSSILQHKFRVVSGGLNVNHVGNGDDFDATSFFYREKLGGLSRVVLSAPSRLTRRVQLPPDAPIVSQSFDLGS